jgi:hypothetical protein
MFQVNRFLNRLLVWTVKEDVLAVEEVTCMDVEGDTLDGGGTSGGVSVVLDLDLGLAGIEHSLVGVALVVLFLQGQRGLTAS